MRLAWLALAACAHEHSVPISIGPSHELFVPATINDTPLSLELDTGASFTTLARAARARAGLRSLPLGPTATGAGGRIEGMEVAETIDTEIGAHGISHERVVVTDLHGARDGLLGMDLLRFFVSDVDLPNRRFALYGRGETSWHTADLIEVACTELATGQIAIAAVVEGHPVTAILDLGANVSFANRRAITIDDQAGAVTAAVGADGHPWQFHSRASVPVSLGTVTLTVPAMFVGDLPIFDDLGLADRPAVILGVDAIAARRVVLDPWHHRVFLSPVRGQGFEPLGGAHVRVPQNRSQRLPAALS